jgi:hypothetical protein
LVFYPREAKILEMQAAYEVQEAIYKRV